MFGMMADQFRQLTAHGTNLPTTASTLTIATNLTAIDPMRRTSGAWGSRMVSSASPAPCATTHP